MYRGTDTKRLQLSKQDDNILPKRKKNGKARGDLKEINTANEWAGEQISGVPFPNPTAACQTKAWVTAHWSFYYFLLFFWGFRPTVGAGSTSAGAADSICFYWYRLHQPCAVCQSLGDSMNMLCRIFFFFLNDCLFQISNRASFPLLMQEKHSAAAWRYSMFKNQLKNRRFKDHDGIFKWIC